MIYLDYNATAPMLPSVREAMIAWLAAMGGNASSAHHFGRRARTAIEMARGHVASAIGSRPSEVVFTSGGTEANNLALFGMIDPARRPHVLASPIEHASVFGPLQQLRRVGVDVEWLPVDADGRIDPAVVSARIRADTALVTVGWANNEVGILQDVAAIAAQCRAKGVLLHVDAVQALGKVELDVTRVDLLSISAHKIGGPQGIGALHVRRGLTLRPLMWGGSQERSVRPGTENAAAIIGFGVAARESEASAQDLAALRERLWGGLRSLPRLRRNSVVDRCLPNTLHVSVSGSHAESVVAALDLEGVAVSAGAACSAGAAEPSRVLLAMGRNSNEAREGVRFSVGRQTTIGEIDAAIAAMQSVMRRLEGPAEQAAYG